MKSWSSILIFNFCSLNSFMVLWNNSRKRTNLWNNGREKTAPWIIFIIILTAAKGADFSQNGGGPTHTMEQQTNNFHSQTSQELGMLSPSLFIQESQCNCYRTQVYLGSDLWVRVSLTYLLSIPWADSTDVTLVYEDELQFLRTEYNICLSCFYSAF